jgi:hypothetical protein
MSLKTKKALGRSLGWAVVGVMVLVRAVSVGLCMMLRVVVVVVSAVTY